MPDKNNKNIVHDLADDFTKKSHLFLLDRFDEEKKANADQIRTRTEAEKENLLRFKLRGWLKGGIVGVAIGILIGMFLQHWFFCY